MSDSKEQQFGSSEVKFDLWGLVSRHFRTIALCILICGALGAVYCAMTDSIYESTAEIHIEEKLSPVFTEETMNDRQTLQSGVETHLLLLKSPMIFEAADEANGIRNLDELKEIEEIKLRSFWEDRLSIKIPDFEASVLDVSYRGKSPEECQQIVESVIDAYGSHLADKSSGLGKEVSKLVNKAKDELLSQLNSMEEEYGEFRKNAPVMWKDGAAVNLHSERQLELEQRRKDLIIERSMTEAKLSAVVKALESGSKAARDAIYYEALIELQKADEKDRHIEREAARGYSTELSREYMQLAMEEKRMAAEVGAGHPDLKVLRSRLREMKKALRAALGDEENSSQIGGEKVDYVAVYTQLLAERISSIKNQLEGLNRSFDREEVAGSKIEEYLTEDERHRSGIARTQSLFDAVVARLEEINIIDEYGGERMEVIAKPQLGKQVWPNIPIIGLLSLIVGSCLGGLLAIVREVTDRVYHDPSEIRSSLGIPVIGQIPANKSKNTLDKYDRVLPAIGTVHDGKSRFSESFRGVRTAFQFSSHRNNLKVVQVTSPLPGDGKSTFVGNLAASAAKGGKRVLVIDADMRRPQIHKIFGEDIHNGLADVLTGVVEINDVIKDTQVENLSIITAGIPPENPSELLSNQMFGETLEVLKEKFDMILVDGPPVLAVSDPSIISTVVDGVVMMLKIRKGVRQTSRKAKEILEDVDANLIGVVVNGVTGRRTNYGYNYGYGYGYGYTGSNKYYEAKADEYDRGESGKSNRVRKNGKSKSSANANGSSGAYPSNGNGVALDDSGPTVNVAEAFRIDDN